MKAITLTQPWASLMTFDEKHFETRSWGTAYRGPLAVHAAKGFPLDCRELAGIPPHHTALKRHGIDDWRGLPRSVVLAVVELVDCIDVLRLAYHDSAHRRPFYSSRLQPQPPLGPEVVVEGAEHEIDFGDYSEGRWIWITRGLTVLDEPQAARGALGLWEWKPGVAIAASLPR